MDQRERLIELLSSVTSGCLDASCKDCKYKGTVNCQETMLADALIQNGILAPPCKIGDDLYWACDNETAKIFDGDPGIGVYKENGGLK